MPSRVLYQMCVAAAFLIANMLILLAILFLSRRIRTRPGSPAPPAQVSPGEDVLDPSDILGWEFEYARFTASEAMRDRQSMVNFYLLAVGFIASAVVTVVGKESAVPETAGTLLLWTLCSIGWLHFLKIIRLRQAWYDSARAMNQIKEFYIRHTKDFTSDSLRDAFRWQTHTLPAPGKPWTVFFYSAMLITLLDSVAYVAGAALIDLDAALSSPPWTGLLLAAIGFIFFAFHVYLYFAFLRPRPSPHTERSRAREHG